MVDAIIDVGHDRFTVAPNKGVIVGGESYNEFDFNYKLAHAIQKILRANNVSAELYPKNGDSVSLRERTNFYNSTNAKLSVSIHANANSNASINGRCVFYWHDDKDAERLAKNVRNEIRELGYSTHGTGLHESRTGSWTNLHMVREPKMPAILIEHGFMTGNKDFSLIFGADQGTYIRDMAEADSRAILDYLGKQYNEPKEEVEVVMSGDLYRVQVGAFASKENAERLAAELKAKGYPVFIPDADTVSIKDVVKPSSTPKPVAKKSIDQLAQETIDGKHGNGADRQKSLGADYAAVQKRVDELLRPNRKSNATIAREVLDGKWGNGAERRSRLEKAGYSFSEVQKLVNQLA